MDSDSLTLKEAMAKTGIDRVTLGRLIDKFQIPLAPGADKREKRITRADLEMLVASRKAATLGWLNSALNAAQVKWSETFFWRGWVPVEAGQVLYRDYCAYLRSLNPSVRLEGVALLVLQAGSIPGLEAYDDSQVRAAFDDALVKPGLKALVRPAYPERPVLGQNTEPLITTLFSEALTLRGEQVLIFLSAPHRTPGSPPAPVGDGPAASCLIFPRESQRFLPAELPVVRLWRLPLADPLARGDKFCDIPYSATVRQFMPGGAARQGAVELIALLERDEAAPDPWSVDRHEKDLSQTVRAQLRELFDQETEVADLGAQFLQRAHEAWTRALAIPPWLHLIEVRLGEEHNRADTPGRGLQNHPFGYHYPPVPPLEFSADFDLLKNSALLQFFELIREVLGGEQHRDSISCQLFVPNEQGDGLAVLAQATNYGDQNPPQLRLDKGPVGLSGRAALRSEPLVSRFGGDAVPSALRDSRLRSGYDTNLVESISIPILGVDEVPAKPYEVRAVSPQRLYGVLYVYSSEQGSRLLPPAHLLWLRELAGVLSVYLSSGKALARRDRHLMQDHERGYHDFLIVSDSEETTEYGLFLAYLAELISTRRRANSPAPTIDEELPVPESAPRPGITFMYIDMAGRVRDERRSLYPATLPEQTELRYRHFQKLFREVGRRMQQFQDEGHIESFAATPYQRGVLVAIKVGEGVLHDKLLRLLRSRCYRFLVRFDTNFRERRGHLPLSAVIFHHSWQGEVGSYLRGSLGDERPEVRKLRTALRVIDPLLAAFRERVAERERADSGSGQEILPGEYHPPVYYNSWVNPAEWDEEPRRDPGERPTAL